MTKGYLIDTIDRSRLEFQVNPLEIRDKDGANYANITVAGFSHPRKQFVAGEDRALAFMLRFYVWEGQAAAEVKNKTAWLRSLLYPHHQGGQLKQGARPVILLYGDLYKDQAWVVKSVDVKYFDKFGKDDLLPHLADVDLVLEEYVEEAVSYSQVRNN